MATLRVRANVDHTDAASGMPRVKDEVFDMEEQRARLKAEQGFVIIEDEQAPAADADVVVSTDGVVDVAPHVMDVRKPRKRKS